ncbi:hypothetical protein ABQX22_22155, partial [Xanthomonas sp. WHRI 1810A]|uniref:hypothetical protein n=1 Tax=Xanthomonas sp. WHRI 1810A TaxID=3161565 RepID=UPI0032E8FF21
GSETFWLLLRRLAKVTRRKGGTDISNTSDNGYSPDPIPSRVRPTASVERDPAASHGLVSSYK